MSIRRAVLALVIAGGLWATVPIATALAYEIVHIYPWNGWNSGSMHPSSNSGNCYGGPYQWGHSIAYQVYAYYTYDEVYVSYADLCGGWETSPYDFEWGVTWLVDGYDSNNTQSYIESLFQPFTGYDVTIWTYKDLNYSYPNLNPYVLSRWSDDGSIWCQGSSYVIIHGPNH
jgi:hypothetical protein